MQDVFEEVEGEFAFAKYMNTSELDEISAFLDESVKASCEGLMVKMLDGEESGYEPSRRSRNWLKVNNHRPAQSTGNAYLTNLMTLLLDRSRKTTSREWEIPWTWSCLELITGKASERQSTARSSWLVTTTPPRLTRASVTSGRASPSSS